MIVCTRNTSNVSISFHRLAFCGIWIHTQSTEHTKRVRRERDKFAHHTYSSDKYSKLLSFRMIFTESNVQKENDENKGQTKPFQVNVQCIYADKYGCMSILFKKQSSPRINTQQIRCLQIISTFPPPEKKKRNSQNQKYPIF